jgi:hypothetical protein
MSDTATTTPKKLERQMKRAWERAYPKFEKVWETRMAKLPESSEKHLLKHFAPSMIDIQIEELIAQVTASGVAESAQVPAAIAHAFRDHPWHAQDDMGRIRLAEVRVALDAWAVELGIASQMRQAMRGLSAPGQGPVSAAGGGNERQ